MRRIRKLTASAGHTGGWRGAEPGKNSRACHWHDTQQLHVSFMVCPPDSVELPRPSHAGEARRWPRPVPSKADRRHQRPRLTSAAPHLTEFKQGVLGRVPRTCNILQVI